MTQGGRRIARRVLSHSVQYGRQIKISWLLMSAGAYQEFKYPRGLLPVLIMPAMCLAAILGINWGLGCSEYAEFQSASCQAVGEYFGVDVYQFLLAPYLVSFYVSAVTVPIVVALLIMKRLVNSHRRRRASEY